MLKGKKGKLFLFGIFLFFVSFLILVLGGNTYTYRFSLFRDLKDEKDLSFTIEQDKEIIKIVDSSFQDGILELKLKSVSRGSATIVTTYKDYEAIETFYVHPFGIITQNMYLGKSNCDIVIPISVFLFTFVLFCMVIQKYLESRKEDFYQYRNITYFAFLFFLFSFLIYTIINIFSYNGLYSTISSLPSSFSFFSFLLFPIAVLVSILVIISNFLLLKKEGFTWKNMLGIIMAFCILIGTILPGYLNDSLQTSTFIDIHNERGIVTHLFEFLESAFIAFVAYLECVLLSTIILSIKAAKHVPAFDKDYLIILGCKIQKDGSLTPLLKGRVDRAIEFAKLQKEKTGKDLVFVPSGGKGNDEVIAEGEAIKNYLLKQGIDKKNILVENQSKNTYQNMKYSYRLIQEQNKESNIAFSTTNYHVFRAGNIAFNQHIKIEGIGSKTKSYFWINAFIREFIATLYSEKRRHIFMFGILVFFALIMQLILYIGILI